MDKKRVLISGGSGSVGAATAKKFLNEGWQVVLADERIDDLKATFEKNINDNIVLLEYNPNEAETSAESLFNEIDSLGMTVDALVTAHQVSGDTQFAEDYEFADWTGILKYNFVGAFMLARHFAERLVRNSKKGSITFLSNVCAKTAVPGKCAYVSSMGAIRSLTKGLALDFGPYGIRVNCVLPGLNSDFPVPIGKTSSPEEIAEILYFFSTDSSGSTTGAELVTDGGTDCLVPGAY